MTTQELISVGELVAEAIDFAELIRMAHSSPEDAEAKAVSAAAHHVVSLLGLARAGLEFHAERAAQGKSA